MDEKVTLPVGGTLIGGGLRVGSPVRSRYVSPCPAWLTPEFLRCVGGGVDLELSRMEKFTGVVVGLHRVSGVNGEFFTVRHDDTGGLAIYAEYELEKIKTVLVLDPNWPDPGKENEHTVLVRDLLPPATLVYGIHCFDRNRPSEECSPGGFTVDNLIAIDPETIIIDPALFPESPLADDLTYGLALIRQLRIYVRFKQTPVFIITDVEISYGTRKAIYALGIPKANISSWSALAETNRVKKLFADKLR